MEKLINRQFVDKLQVFVFAERQSLGQYAARQTAAKIREFLSQQAIVRMIFAAAPSQNEFLDCLACAPDIDWERIHAFHMDEYIGLQENAPQSFGRYLACHLFERVHPGWVEYIRSGNDIDAECRRYGALIQEAPVDIVCMGIGENGHIAFNDPPVADFDDPDVIKPVNLDMACRRQQVHDKCFPSLDNVPTQALTLTVPALFSGRCLYCMVPGATKREAVCHTLRDTISEACPATVLRKHPNSMLFVDTDSFGEDTL